MYAVQPLLPIFTREFHINAATSSLALSLTTGCLAVSMLAIGAVAEGWSRKPLMSLSLLSAALLTLLSSVFQDWPDVSPDSRHRGNRDSRLAGARHGVSRRRNSSDDVGVSMGLYVGSGALGGMTGRPADGRVDRSVFVASDTGGNRRPRRCRRRHFFQSAFQASARFQPRSLSMAALVGSYKAHLARSRDPDVDDRSGTRARHARHGL
jgi:YNFM family putative membrane transporter